MRLLIVLQDIYNVHVEVTKCIDAEIGLHPQHASKEISIDVLESKRMALK